MGGLVLTEGKQDVGDERISKMCAAFSNCSFGALIRR